MRVVIVGGSVAGLSAGILFARRGHEVTVVEQDDLSLATPDGPDNAGLRRGAPQTPHGHAVIALGVKLLRGLLPDVYEGLRNHGVPEITYSELMPPTIADRRRQSGDDDLRLLPCRRITFDRVLRAIANVEPRLTVRDRERVIGLIVEPERPAVVRGVRTRGGDIVDAAITVDASGGRSLASRWLALAGAPIEMISRPCGLAYYSRQYVLRPGTEWPSLNRGYALGAVLPRLEFALVPSDNRSAQVSVVALGADRAMTRLRSERVFTRLLESIPELAACLALLEPTSRVYAMASGASLLSRLVRDGLPSALGFFAAGDALCTTNPTFGRGIALALLHVQRLLDVVERTPDAVQRALGYDRFVCAEVLPRFEEAARLDRLRVQTIRHHLFGETLPGAEPHGAIALRDLSAAAGRDGWVWRRLARANALLDPPGSLENDPELADRVRVALAAGALPPRFLGASDEAIARAVADP